MNIFDIVFKKLDKDVKTFIQHCLFFHINLHLIYTFLKSGRIANMHSTYLNPCTKLTQIKCQCIQLDKNLFTSSSVVGNPYLTSTYLAQGCRWTFVTSRNGSPVPLQHFGTRQAGNGIMSSTLVFILIILERCFWIQTAIFRTRFQLGGTWDGWHSYVGSPGAWYEWKRISYGLLPQNW